MSGADEEVHEDVPKHVLVWHEVALVNGYNALATEAKLLAQKVYFRMARDAAQGRAAALGVTVELTEPGPRTLVIDHCMPHIVFHERDIEGMRAAVAEFDARPTTDPQGDRR